MKKTFYFFAAFLCYYSSYSQLLPSGTSTIDNKFRSGGLALGYTTLPSFSTNKFLVNGSVYFSGNLGLGVINPSSMFHMPNGTLTIGDYFTTYNDDSINWGLKTDRSIVLKPKPGSIYGSIDVQYGDTSSLIQIAIATCNGCFSSNALQYDAVLRGNSSGSFIITNERAGNIKFSTRPEVNLPSEVNMVIDNNGNVGVGTETPDAKLAVNGVIHSKEVKVDLVGWPDYVFHENYTLPTLEEVEKHIIDNGHLINVPSAQEVESNGLKLGEMNKVLLEKIEELTLYILQMNKEIEKLKHQLNSK